MSSLMFNDSSIPFMFNDSPSSLMFNNLSTSSLLNKIKDEFNRYAQNVNRTLLYIQIFICAFGLLGNLLALIVINKKSLKNTSLAVFITYMAIFDSAVLIFHALNLTKLHRNLFLRCSLTFFTDLSVFCANWVLAIITLERCVAVYSPFLAKRFCTVHSARRSIYLLITISALFFSITFPFLYQTKGVAKNQKCRIHPHTASLVRIAEPILFIAIPGILLLSNLFIVFVLCQRQQRLSSTSCIKNGENLEMRISDVHSNRKQRQLTITLVTVCLSFYLFKTPAMISFIMELQPQKHKELEKMKRSFLFGQSSVVFYELDHATNFIFYCFTGQRFRQATRQTLQYYSRRLKLFYHRYILCDKEYYQIPAIQYNVSSMVNTTISHRNSASPHYLRHQFRTSTT